MVVRPAFRSWEQLQWSVNRGDWSGWVVTGLGLLLTVLSVKGIVAPVTLLRADARGITLYTACTSRTWDKLNKKLVTAVRPGNPCLIPWNKITSIDRGLIDEKEPALRVLCDPSIYLDDCRRTDLLDAWTGLSVDDTDPHNAQDRRSLPQEHLLSGFALREMFLKDSLAKTIGILTEMRQRWS